MKGSLIGLVLAAVGGIAIVAGSAVGCSSSSSGGGGGGGGGLSCLSADKSLCYTYPSSVTTCPSGMSTSSCPTTPELGCCTTTATGSNGQSASVTSCYYCEGALATSGAMASTYAGTCTGSTMKWAAGDKTSCGGAGDGGSSSSSGGSSSSSGGTGDASAD